MAEKKKNRVVKKAETLRERTAKQAENTGKSTKARRVVRSASRPLTGAVKASRKEFHPFKFPDNKIGRFLNKRISLVPSYIKNSVKEVQLVQWPNARETTKLTFAVLSFAIVFGAVVYVLDIGLDKIFRQLLLG